MNWINHLGDYQRIVRVGGVSFLGIGHTPQEATRNACEAVYDRWPTLRGLTSFLRDGQDSGIEISYR